MGQRDPSGSPPPPPPSTSKHPSSRSQPRHSSPHADSRSRRPAAPPAAPPAPQSPPIPPVSAGRLPYSLPPLQSMNPNYPPHHSPYLPPQHYPHHLQGPPPVPTNGPPMPGMYPYGLPAHYGHHPYAYPHQYAPLGPGGFPPPRPPDAPHPDSPQRAQTPPKSVKRKRKSEDRKEDDRDGNDLKKRTKTQRACDSCRSRKIRCDVLTDSDPPVCQHCKQYGFDCTFFLPITETRFKKKRLEEEAQAAAAAAVIPLPAISNSDEERRTTTPQTAKDPAKGETRVYGPTNAAYLLHSTATVPSRVYESYDLRYHLTCEVSDSGDTFIQVQEPASDETGSAHLPLRIDRDTIQRLLNSYFNELSPIYTVVTREDLLSQSSSPPPVLLYAICSVAAASRDVPQTVFDTLRNAVSAVIKSEDVLSTTSIVNVQALLVLGMCGDCHSQYVPKALSAFWLRVGTAIRMAQDLGLHRAESVKQNLDMRRRLWSACVIADRWCSLTYGHPYMIDVQDCDVRLNNSDKVEDMYMNELLKLSILLGRVLKLIYSPSGLVLATDMVLEDLLQDMDKWNQSLPAALRFTGPTTCTKQAGLLHLFYSCVSMLFWRVFMRISYTIPAHLSFALTVERWSELVRLTRESIEWLDLNERLYDVWMMVSYCATGCALVQYHTWARRKDPEAAATLRKLRDCIRRWDTTVPAEHRSTRRKTSEIISLLYESTQLPLLNPSQQEQESPSGLQGSENATPLEHLNPTTGVRPRESLPEGLMGLMFKKDEATPGGGVFVATERLNGDYSGIPTGMIILKSGGDATGATSNAADTAASGVGVGAMSEAGMSLQKGMVYTPIGAGPSGSGSSMWPNVNPHLNDAQPAHRIFMNTLEEEQQEDGSAGPHPAVLQQHLDDNGLLEGMPGHMFDWAQWDTFFAKFPLQGEMPGGGGGGEGGQVSAQK